MIGDILWPLSSYCSKPELVIGEFLGGTVAHFRRSRLWLTLSAVLLGAVGGYGIWVATSSQSSITTSTAFDQRSALFDTVPGLRFTSLGLNLTVGEPNSERQQVGLLAFPHADGAAGVTFANTYRPIGNLDVLLDMQRVASNSLALNVDVESAPGGMPAGSLIEYVDGQAVGPIPGGLQITHIDGRSLSTYPFDEYETRLLSWANVLNGDRVESITERDYTTIPIDVHVENTSQGTFATYVDLLSTENVFGGPRPEGGILSISRTIEIPNSEEEFVAAVQESNAVQVYFSFSRTPPTKFLALLVYGIMLITALSVLGVTIWVASRKKVIALSAAIWAVAVVFTILEARRILPGGPPIGGYGDLIAFFPSLAIAAMCAVILVFIWIRRENYAY